MIIFIVLCVAMIMAALLLVARPLIQARAALPTLLILGVLVPFVAAGLYWIKGHRTWERDQMLAQARAATQQDVAANIARLEAFVKKEPNDADALLNLAELLIQQDERNVAGRAGELVERVLTLSPNNPRALFYGAMKALSMDKLPLARERLQRVLASNPPENIRSIIQRQIDDIGQQLGEQQAAAVPAAPGRAITVHVSLKPELLPQVDKNTSLFVLARDSRINGGPPLAVKRGTAGDLPLEVTLTDNDAMLQGRGISSVSNIQVVARISKSGTPQAQVGDLFGESTIEFKDQKAVAVKIAIDRKVEK